MKEDIVLIDLFSGVGGFSLGLKMAGFNITHHYFSEIDKNSVGVYKYHFKNAEYVGSVIDVSGTEIRAKHPTARIIICFGWPCQDNSIAGKRKGHTEGTRSNLLIEAVRVIQEVQPDYFIAENVKGLYSVNEGVDFVSAIRLLSFLNCDSPQYEVEQQLLNTSWFLPQNRERTYFVGYPAGGGCRQILPIREGDERTNERTGETISVRTITAGGMHSSMTLIAHYGHKDKPFTEHENCPTLKAESHGHIPMIKEYTNLQANGVVNTIRSGGRGSLTEKHNWDLVKSVATPGRKNKKQNGSRFKEGDSFTLCSQEVHGVMITSGVKKGYELAQIGDTIDFQNPTSKTRKGRVSKGKTNTLDTSCMQGILTETTIRRLTEIECERLQGFPDDWTKYSIHVLCKSKKGLITEFYGFELDKVIETSATQRYKQMGNAVSTPAVKAVGERILNDMRS